jgi:hypothetical protein
MIESLLSHFQDNPIVWLLVALLLVALFFLWIHRHVSLILALICAGIAYQKGLFKNFSLSALKDFLSSIFKIFS